MTDHNDIPGDGLQNLYPVGHTKRCSFNAKGVLSIPQALLERLGWQQGQEITGQLSARHLIIKLSPATPEHPGFTLSYSYKYQGQPAGGKLTLRSFANNTLRSRGILPLSNIPAVVIPAGRQNELGLKLVDLAWKEKIFSKADIDGISAKLRGVYKLLGAGGETLRIGEGQIRSRMKEHLKNEALARDVHNLQYIATKDKAEARFIEQVLFHFYQDWNGGDLPPHNAIRG